MRRIRYQVACSLDGYIAGPDGEYDWIVMDPDIDFGELFAEFDTLLMGRRTFETLEEGFPEMAVFVFSRTLRQVFTKSGIVLLTYDVVRGSAPEGT